MAAPRSRWFVLLWALLPFLAALGGAAFPPDQWFAALAKPSWQPPNYLFGPVWTTLYLMMGIAAGLVWLRGPSPAVRAALIVFVGQLVPVSYTHLDVYKRQHQDQQRAEQPRGHL